MKILALEFSSPVRSAAVIERNESGATRVRSLFSDGGSREVRPMQLVEETLTRAALRADEVTHLAVSRGPGSYTGLRAGIAIAQGWQLARGTPVFAPDAFEALAFDAQQNGWIGDVCLAVDAQRGEFYFQRWRISADERTPAGTLCLLSKDALVAESASGILAGPSLPGDLTHRELFPSACALALVALGGKSFTQAEALEPIYLRETSFVKAPAPRIVP